MESTRQKVAGGIMKGQYEARITRLESVRRFNAPIRSQAEIDAEVDADKERIRQSLIDGTYQHPTFTGNGLLTIEQEQAMWDAYLMDIPEYKPFLLKSGA